MKVLLLLQLEVPLEIDPGTFPGAMDDKALLALVNADATISEWELRELRPTEMSDQTLVFDGEKWVPEDNR